jgi:hypothetical protein
MGLDDGGGAGRLLGGAAGAVGMTEWCIRCGCLWCLRAGCSLGVAGGWLLGAAEELAAAGASV